MFNIFKNRLHDAKSIRFEIVLFIKEQLKKLGGGDGELISGMVLFIQCTTHERFMYESALYYSDPLRFKQDEIQKIADDFALSLPFSWYFEINFVEKFPLSVIQCNSLPIALQIVQHHTIIDFLPVSSTAVIKTLHGETEQSKISFSKEDGRINIGRDRTVNLSNGTLRENKIIFLSDSNVADNKTVSRQHCHIEWSEKDLGYALFADEGGIPPLNKTKLKSGLEKPIKIQTTELGYRLNNGDLIILGDAVVLEFNLVS